jgi:hypothetical protein
LVRIWHGKLLRQHHSLNLLIPEAFDICRDQLPGAGQKIIYGIECKKPGTNCWICAQAFYSEVVGAIGFEPTTSSVSGKRSPPELRAYMK